MPRLQCDHSLHQNEKHSSACKACMLWLDVTEFVLQMFRSTRSACSSSTPRAVQMMWHSVLDCKCTCREEFIFSTKPWP
jgi:hypothetical protein